MAAAWMPRKGMEIEVMLAYPICAGSVKHFCWKIGTVAATLMLKGRELAAVELTVVSGTCL